MLQFPLLHAPVCSMHTKNGVGGYGGGHDGGGDGGRLDWRSHTLAYTRRV